MRDGKAAVELATRAVELARGGDLDAVIVLGQALAETGDFEGAVKQQELAIASCPAQQVARLKALQDSLKLYQAGKPFRRREPFLPPAVVDTQTDAKPPLEAEATPAPEEAPATDEPPAKPPLDAPPADEEEVKPPLP